VLAAAPGTLAADQAPSRTPVADRIRGQRVAAEHPPMEAPTVVPAALATHMRGDDVVLGTVVSGEARAYPWWVVKHFHAVNDTIAGIPVAVAFCEQCTGGAAFRRTLGSQILSMEVPGVYNGTIVLRDRETRTLWAPFSGRALEGPLAGQKLDRVPLSMMRWDEWRERHPATGVLWGPDQARGGHGSWYEPGKWGIVAEMGSTIQAWDARLPENTLVYGVEAAGRARSYTLAALKARGVLNDELGGIPLVLAARGALEVAAFDRRAGGRTLTFSASGDPASLMVDRETGTAWSVEGRAVQGALAGEALRPLDGYVVEWHVWAAYNPGTAIVDVDVAPAPRDAGAFPDLALVPVNGKAPQEVRRTAAVNLVVLWASWCAPCRAELPALQALSRKHPARRLGVVGIAMTMPDDEPGRSDVRRVLSESAVTFPNHFVDEAAYDRLEALARGAGRPGIVLPMVFLVEGERVRGVFSGDEMARLEGEVDRFLGLEAATAASRRTRPVHSRP
jgi:thiol-disulfide isomerase/thioredoxin